MSIQDQALRSGLADADLTPGEAAALGVAPTAPAPTTPVESLGELESECPSVGAGLWFFDDEN